MDSQASRPNDPALPAAVPARTVSATTAGLFGAALAATVAYSPFGMWVATTADDLTVALVSLVGLN